MVWRLTAFAVMVLQAALIVFHRPWIDEWQALQIAVQSPGLRDLWTNFGYEGHPPAWFVVLRALAQILPDPRMALPVAALLCALPAQALILFASPFSRTDRLLLALGEPVLFELFTVSRSLTLGAGLVIAALALWRHRHWPWLAIALLPACEALFGLIAIGLIVLRWRDKRLSWPGLALWLALALVAAWSVYPPADLAPALHPAGVVLGGATWLHNLGAVAIPLQWGPNGAQWNRPPLPPFDRLGAFALFALIGYELRKDRLALAIIAGFGAATFVLAIRVYPLSVRHLMLVALLLVALVWHRAANGGAGPSRAMRAWLAIGALCGLFTAAIGLTRTFDTAPEAAAAMARMGLTDKVWVAWPRSAAQGIAALTGMAFERLGERCTEDFIRWSSLRETPRPGADGVTGQLAAKHARIGTYYLVANAPLHEPADLLHLLATVPPGYDGQAFFLYRVGDAGREAPRTSARCVAAWRPLDPH